MVDRLAQNGAPNRVLKTSYKELLDAVESCSDKALKRAIRTAVEEKSRYVAERIARTESARAWYQGFLKDTMDDPDVVAYRWVESTRHPTEDICDEYAKVDAYGLGPGIFPKDKAPELPAHAHCLCHYEKVYASELNVFNGLANGDTPYSKDHVTVVRESDIAYNDDEAVEARFLQFCKDHEDSDVEYALVITKDGEVYSITGDFDSVDISIIGEKLNGAKVIHNHPDNKNNYGDCFSKTDFSTYFRWSIGQLDVTSGLGRFTMKYSGNTMTAEKAVQLYDEAYNEVVNLALWGGKTIKYIQKCVMEELNAKLEHLEYKEYKTCHTKKN